MLPWLILTAVLLLVITGLIVERAVSGYLIRKEFARLRAENQRNFASLGQIQKSLFVALKSSYDGQERAYKFVADQIRATDKKMESDRMTDPRKVKQTFRDASKPATKENDSGLWPDVIGGKEE